MNARKIIIISCIVGAIALITKVVSHAFLLIASFISTLALGLKADIDMWFEKSDISTPEYTDEKIREYEQLFFENIANAAICFRNTKTRLENYGHLLTGENVLPENKTKIMENIPLNDMIMENIESNSQVFRISKKSDPQIFIDFSRPDSNNVHMCGNLLKEKINQRCTTNSNESLYDALKNIFLEYTERNNVILLEGDILLTKKSDLSSESAKYPFLHNVSEDYLKGYAKDLLDYAQNEELSWEDAKTMFYIPDFVPGAN